LKRRVESVTFPSRELGLIIPPKTKPSPRTDMERMAAPMEQRAGEVEVAEQALTIERQEREREREREPDPSPVATVPIQVPHDSPPWHSPVDPPVRRSVFNDFHSLWTDGGC
jgi:hypothetical protein